MPESQPYSLAVVGAAGFVGRELLRTLQAAGIRATAVVRGAPELAVEGDFHAAAAPDEAARSQFDVVINLAYPNSGPPWSYPGQNDAILATVSSLVRDGGRLIHASTQAVFGLAVDRPVEVGPVAAARDHPYVEAKIAAEHKLAERQPGRGWALDVVRFGNVWGYASGAWGVPVVQRLVTGRPVGVEGIAGLSNTTDVRNAASYLTWVLQEGEAAPGLRFHHLAEFSSVAWMEWIEPVAEALGVEPVLIDPSVLEAPGSGWQEVGGTVRAHGPRALYRELAAERVAGSWARSALAKLPQSVFWKARGREVVTAPGPEADRAEQGFLAIMAARQEFKSHTDPRWRPALTQEQSLSRFLEWVARD